MHDWSNEKIDWQGLNDAADEIGSFISRYGRMHVSQCKEKFGTVRVYCNFTYSGWLRKYQEWIYVLAYNIAVRKRPHLYLEIICSADWGELFDGHIPGYKHSDYWRKL